jgi:chromosome segregation ATPase
MAEIETTADVASFTHEWMRRVEQKVDKSDSKLERILEILVRHETRLSRIEREIGEIKFDMTSLDGRMTSLTTDVLRVLDKLDEQAEKIDGLGQRVEQTEAKL